MKQKPKSLLFIHNPLGLLTFKLYKKTYIIDLT